MMSQGGNDMGSISARGKKKSATRRPLLVGALAAGVVALGASAAVAVGTIDSPSPGPAPTGNQSTSMMPGMGADMMDGKGAYMMDGMGADMMDGMGAESGTNMMGDGLGCDESVGTALS